MSSSVLAYAFLRASYGRHVENPIDVIEPLVKRALMDVKGNRIDQAAIQKSVMRIFGLEIPLNVIRYTFPRLGKKGILSLNQSTHMYEKVDKNYKDDEIIAIEKKSRNQYRRLTSRILGVLRKLEIDNISEDEVLEGWLDTSAISFLGGGGPVSYVSNKDYEFNRIISHAIRNRESGNHFVDDLMEVTLGDALFRAIKEITECDAGVNPESDTLSPEAVKSYKSKMKDVKVFFDTKMVLRSIDLVDDELKKGTDELIKLCQALDSNICVFTHTIEELKRIIQTVAQRMKHGTPTGDVASVAYKRGWGPGDLISLSLEVEEKVKAAGFDIVPPPLLTEGLSINETDLDRQLQVDMRQESEYARTVDVGSLSSIHRLRQGKPKRYMEHCDAIFITTNKRLADIAVAFFRNHYKDETLVNRVQHCMTDVVFSTRLWTKLPTSIEYVPRYQVVSHALGNLVPDLRLKENFRSQIRSLVKKGKLSDEDAAKADLIRYTDEILALEYKMGTQEISEDAAYSLVCKVIDKQKQHLEEIKEGRLQDREQSESELKTLRAEMVSKLECASIETVKKESKLNNALEEVAKRDRNIQTLSDNRSNIKQKIGKISRSFTRVLAVICAISVSYAVFDAVGWVSGVAESFEMKSIKEWSKWLVASANVVALFVMGGFTFFGFSVFKLEKWVELKLTKIAINFFFEPPKSG